MAKQPNQFQIEDAYFRLALRDVHETLVRLANRYCYAETTHCMGHPNQINLLNMLQSWKYEIQNTHREIDSTADKWIEQNEK